MKMSESIRVEIGSFLESLENLFDIAHAQVIDIIQKDTCRTKAMKVEDTNFLQDQRSDRKMVLSSLDKTYIRKLERKQSRSEQE